MFKRNAEPLIIGRRSWLNAKIRQWQRQDHCYIIGGSRTGKTSEIYNLIVQEIKAKRNVGLVDVHGDLAMSLEKAVYRLIPDRKERKERVTVLDPTRGAFGFNPLEVPEGKDPYPYVLELITVFKKLWQDSWGPRMEDIFRNALLVLAEKKLTLMEVTPLLTDQAFRNCLIQDLANEQVKEYWLSRFNPLTATTKAEWVESTLNKVGTFIADPLIKAVVGQRTLTVNLRQIMDYPGGSVLLVRLPKGILMGNAFLMGALLTSKIQEAAMSRVNIPLEQRRKFFLYVDEFHNFGAKSLNFQECLSESGKYGISLTLVHQNLDQIEKDLLASILGNSSIRLVFRIQREDTEKIAKNIFQIDTEKVKWERTRDFEVLSRTYYTPQEEWENKFKLLTNLKNRAAYLNIIGKGTYPFRSIDTQYYPMPEQEFESQTREVMSSYCKSTEEIKQERQELKKELQDATTEDITIETMRE